MVVPDVDPIVVEDPVEPTKEGEAEPQTKMEGEEKKDMEAENPMMMMGNLAFLGVAASHVAGITL